MKLAGHIISDKGHKPGPLKVEVILNMPAPNDVPGMRRFLGMANYFGKYVDRFSQLCNPLPHLTKGSTTLT